MTSPDIQKDLIHVASSLTTKAIMLEIGNGLFTLLVDESRDISVKEQMAVALRYVDIDGCVIERFVGIVHVRDTSSLSLKVAIDSFFSKHGLSISCLRGQGYDGASNMRAVSKKNNRLVSFFLHLGLLSNIVGASCKRRDLLREKQFEKIMEGIYNGEIETGTGLNQELGVKRAGDTRWGSHYGTICSVINLFSSILDVLEVIEEDAAYDANRGQASDLRLRLQTFEFVFILHMMKALLGITNELSQVLQRKDQDIVNAMAYVKVSKVRLQKMRDNGWENLLEVASLFCDKHKVEIPNMDELFIEYGRSRRNSQEMKNLDYYRFELFYSVIDLQLMELDSRFNEVNTELLLCMACLHPKDSFSTFNLHKLLRFATFYPSDFSSVDIMTLEDQLQNYIEDVCSDDQFANLNGIGELAKQMVSSGKHIGYPLVYLLIKLALLLPNC